MAESSAILPYSMGDVWAALANLEAWPEWWYPDLEVTGSLAVGDTVVLKELDDYEEDFSQRFTVTANDGATTLTLAASVFFGALTTTRTFRLEPDGTYTRLTLSETHGGWMVWALGANADADLERLVDRFGSRGEIADDPLVRTEDEFRERLPTLLRDFVCWRSFAPNLYYRWTEERVDQGGGGLNSYSLTLYEPWEDGFVAHSVIDDGGYDAWGTDYTPVLKFKEKPAVLGTEPLFLPAILCISIPQVGLLIRKDLTEGLATQDVLIRDAYGDTRKEYAHLPLEESTWAEAEERAASGVLVVKIWEYGSSRVLIHRDLAARWDAADGLLTTTPLREYAELEPMPGSYTRLDDWQAGNIEVLR